jgi:outer membrane protein
MKTTKILLASAFLAAATMLTTDATAQKIAHINSNDLLQLMPEVKSANKEMEAYSKQLEEQLSSMTAELQKKYDEYTKTADKMPDAVKDLKEKEIQQLQERIETFRETARESVQNKEKQLLEPIIKKAKEAVQSVAKENGYAYVLDTSTGAVIMFPDSDNLMSLVKKKLNISDSPAPATPKPAQK